MFDKSGWTGIREMGALRLPSTLTREGKVTTLLTKPTPSSPFNWRNPSLPPNLDTGSGQRHGTPAPFILATLALLLSLLFLTLLLLLLLLFLFLLLLSLAPSIPSPISVEFSRGRDGIIDGRLLRGAYRSIPIRGVDIIRRRLLLRLGLRLWPEIRVVCRNIVHFIGRASTRRGGSRDPVLLSHHPRQADPYDKGQSQKGPLSHDGASVGTLVPTGIGPVT